MNRDEALLRFNAATTRLQKTAPTALILHGAIVMAGSAFRWAICILVGIAAVKTAGLTLWWGLPAGLAFGWFVSVVWRHARRGARVRYLERMVAAAEPKVTP